MEFILPAIVGSWLFLQIAALVVMRGAWRTVATVPAFAMTLAIAFGVLGAMAGGSMAPMWIVVALPFCMLWLILLWLARGTAALFAR